MSAPTTNRWVIPNAALPAATAVGLAPEALALVKPEHSPQQAVSILAASGHPGEAVRLVPFGLSAREAVWWAAQCVRTAAKVMADPLSAPALDAAEKWCAEPNDDLRRAALTAAEATKLATPAGCVAMAVFLSEGSLAPKAVKETVPPPPNAAQSMAGNAVLLAAVAEQPELAKEKYAAYLKIAEAVASGVSRWAESKPASGTKPPPAPGTKREIPPYPTSRR